MNKDFTKTQANQFIKDWDKRYNNNQTIVALPTTNKKKAKASGAKGAQISTPSRSADKKSSRRGAQKTPAKQTKT